MSGRFNDTLHMYPVTCSFMSGLRLSDLLSTANMDPQPFQSTMFSTMLNEAVGVQQKYEQEEEEKRELLRQKYEYLVVCIDTFGSNYSIDFSLITYLDAMFLFQEVVSQMSSYYLDQRFKMLIEINERNKSQEATDQDTIALLTEKMVSYKKMGTVVMYNKPYMIHCFTQKWMARYPDTDKATLQNDLDISYKGVDIMCGLSPKGNHVERMEEMQEFEIDSKKEWFVDYEQFQTDVKEFPEFAIYQGMD